MPLTMRSATNTRISSDTLRKLAAIQAEAKRRGISLQRNADRRTPDQQAELARCAADLLYWVRTYCWTYDPRETISTIRFHPYPRQEEFLLWLGERDRRREDGLAEKSRDVGFTWLCVYYAIHCWRFNPGDATGFGSRNWDLVDILGDPDTIFEKIRICLRNLPAWMLPEGFEFGVHDTYCRVRNPENGSIIAGQGGNNIGRGGRKRRYFVDEAPFLERPKMVDAALLANTDVRIDIGTPNGVGNPFYTKRFSGTVPVFTFHYSHDPRKTPEWVAKKKASTDPVTWAQEYEIDYSASLEGVCIPSEWVRAAVGLFESPAFRAAYPDYAPPPQVVAGFDVAEEGKNQSVLIPRRGPLVQTPSAWGQMNTTRSAWKARDEAARLGVSVLHYDCVGVGAGVRGTWESSETALPFQAHALRGGEAATDTRWPDGKLSSERFVNLRAELAWIVRTRFEKAFEFVTQGIEHPASDMISIPNVPELLADLSLPLYFTTETGKIQLEGKKDMQKRGVKSPDFFDALCYSFARGVPALQTDSSLHEDFWNREPDGRDDFDA